MKVGKLYFSKTDYFLLYSAKEDFTTIFKYLHDHPGGSPYQIGHGQQFKTYDGNEPTASGGVNAARYWSNILKNTVTYCPKSAIFLILHVERYDDFRICAKVLVNENIGWIMVKHNYRYDQTVLVEVGGE